MGKIKSRQYKKQKRGIETQNAGKQSGIQPIHPSHYRSPVTNPQLPPETWNHIFKLSGFSPEEFLVVINTCPEWNELLASQKTSTLLPMIIPVLVEYLPRNSILNCRGVSQAAKFTIDKILQDVSISPSQVVSVLDHEESARTRNILKKVGALQKSYDFNGNITAFLNCIGMERSANGNPFLTSSASIYLPIRSRDDVEDYDNLQLIFSNFGQHINKISIQVGVNQPDFADEDECIPKLLAVLNCVPQLEMLEIHAPSWNLGWLTAESQTLIASLLPSLEKLSCVDVKRLCSFQDVSFACPLVIKYGSHITTLACSNSFFHAYLDPSSLSILLPHVKKLHVQNVDLATLETLRLVEWNLDELKLESMRSLKLKKLLQTLCNFEATLTQLSIRVFLLDCHNVKNVCKKLPPMQKLKMVVTDMDKMKWLWNFFGDKCHELEEIQLTTKFESDIEAFNRRAFQHLPRLNRILYWCVADTNATKKIIFHRANALSSLIRKPTLKIIKF